MLFNPIRAPQPTVYTIDAAETLNVLNSIFGIAAVPHNPGINDFLVHMAATLTDEQQMLHMATCGMFGLNSMVRMVDPLPATFLAYLDALEAADPVELRDRIMNTLHTATDLKLHTNDDAVPLPDTERMLADRAYYLDYLRNFPLFDDFDPAIFDLAHHLLTHPAELQQRWGDLLTWLWHEHVAAEWARAQPIIQASVDALRHISTAEMAPLDAIRAVTGRNLHGILRAEAVNSFTHIRLVPSLHNGPYITSLGLDDTLIIIFGARVPEQSTGTTLDHAELLNQLKAMGDAMRLDILIALHQHGEMSTGQIMDRFDLNKSAASRHLRNLRAAELLDERRDDDGKGKFYALNSAGINMMLATLHTLLG